MAEIIPNASRQIEEQKPAVPEKRVAKVVDGKVTTKKNKTRKFRDIFIAEDIHTVVDHAITDMAIPMAKELFFKVLKDGLEMLMFGKDGARTSSGKSRASLDTVSYRQYYDRGESYRQPSTRNSTRFDYEDIVFESRGQAEAVISEMEHVIGRYGFVTVADLFDMVDLTAPYTGNKYGWTSVRHAEPLRLVGGGYIIKLPKAIPID